MNKFYGTGLLLVCCLVLLTACGNTNQAHASPTNRGQMSTSSAQVSTNASTTNTSTVQTNTSVSTTKAVDAQITLADFHITSSLMTFTAGVPYHFTVTNKGKVAHELMLMSTTMKTMNMSGMPMNNMDQMALASLEAMNPGTIKTFDYTFVFATAGAHPELSCHLPGHYENGMHLDITVSK